MAGEYPKVSRAGTGEECFVSYVHKTNVYLIDTGQFHFRICADCLADVNRQIGSVARKTTRASAKELVEGLRLDADLLDYCKRVAPDFDAETELSDFKLRMRANGYKVGKNAVKDARAAFQYHMRQAVKFGFPVKRGGAMRPAVKKAATPERKEF